MSRDTGEDSRVGSLLQTVSSQVRAGGVVVFRTEKGVDVIDSYAALSVAERRTWGSMNIALMIAGGNVE